MDFQIGEVQFEDGNPCQRCVVPTRDPVTGAVYPAFPEIFARQRQRTLPPWAQRSRFDYFYRLSVNTNIPADQTGKVLHVGDKVKCLGIRPGNIQ